MISDREGILSSRSYRESIAAICFEAGAMCQAGDVAILDAMGETDGGILGIWSFVEEQARLFAEVESNLSPAWDGEWPVAIEKYAKLVTERVFTSPHVSLTAADAERVIREVLA